MNSTDRQAHWQNVYATKAEKEVSWFQENPDPSLDLIAATGMRSDAAIIDVGGGASRLVDSLLEKGFSRVTILDLSTNALEQAKKRLGRRADGIDWIAADVTGWEPSSTYDLWHDRAAFHFLTKAADRDAYVVFTLTSTSDTQIFARSYVLALMAARSRPGVTSGKPETEQKFSAGSPRADRLHVLRSDVGLFTLP